MTLAEGRILLNKRLGRQYNRDASGQALLDMWLNAACRRCWESQALDFNLTSTATIPTITDDAFTLPSTCKALIRLRYSSTGDPADEATVPHDQEGRTIRILWANITPSRMLYVSYYTDVVWGDDGSSDLPTAIWDYLVTEYAAALAMPYKKDQMDFNLNRADRMFRQWINSFSIAGDHASLQYSPDGVGVDKQSGIYSAGEIEK